MTTIWLFIISFVISAITGSILIPRIVLTAKRKRLFDQVNERTVHQGAVSRLGGISFYPAMMISFCLTMALGMILWPDVVIGKVTYSSAINITFLSAGLALIFIAGFYDDIVEIGYKHKFLSQFVAAAMIAVPICQHSNFFGFFGIHDMPYAACAILLMLVVVFIINAYNLIDGVDGLCSGLSVLSLTVFAWLFGRRGDIFVPILAAGCIGVLLVFMRHNIFGKRLKIFMGDSGSQFLGYVISFMVINYVASDGAIIHFARSSNVFAIAFGVIFVPVFDALRLFIIRLCSRKSPFAADKNHIHHKFLTLGFSHIVSSGFIILFQLIIIFLNISIIRCFDDMATCVVLIDIALGVLLILLLNMLNRRKAKLESI